MVPSTYNDRDLYGMFWVIFSFMVLCTALNTFAALEYHRKYKKISGYLIVTWMVAWCVWGTALFTYPTAWLRRECDYLNTQVWEVPMSKVHQEIKVDTAQHFCIIGGVADDPKDLKWDYAYCIVEGDKIFINAAAGATLDRKHALLFAEKLKAMALTLPESPADEINKK